MSAWWITLATLAIGIGFVAFGVAGSVTSKARVAGVTVPAGGSIGIAAPSAGVLVASFVPEGRFVRAGQPLFELSTERQSGAGEVSAIVSEQLAVRQNSLDTERRLRVAQTSERQQALQERLESLKAEAGQVDAELALAQRRYQLAERGVKQYEALQGSGYVSSAQMQQKQEDLLDLAGRINNIERNTIQLRASRRNVEAELRALDMALAGELTQLERARSSLAQEAAENRSRKSVIVSARASGVLTTLTSRVGQAVTAGHVLGTVIPSASEQAGMGEMEVQLYAPSRTAGFVAPGQEVLIRYQAFPYQKFGLQRGRVSDVSATPFAPAELPPSLASTILSNAQQHINGFNSSEALYRIRVKLARQSIDTYGKEQPLRPGMTLEADLVQDRRRIWEWIAEPLLAVAHR
ncbi:HlyD family secretion protein [Pseudoduganella chitinolytica]|uniref:HlyD family efflux transporter periplasmic adaptor subunit n=1 Tax=Pseudoduganella chitinolytica TaxID=34070 RepID=A0ABY8B701_9BURK|nr:HlyD family efflux transporter periplasmic adaptor subunit [Pseudoduganella chitinolytica]WEF31570.1 HlyD family efflux transporter periplasmic adaptor subunit [Pseudoduganella chitinolytica]